MKVNELELDFVNEVSFSFKFSIYVPETSGCYVLSSIHRDVLYIGMTNNFLRRMEEHLRDLRMNQRTSLGFVAWFNYHQLEYELCYQTEQALLFQHKFKEGRIPILNRIDIL